MIIIETCPECGHDLMDEVITTYPPIPQKKCYNCGFTWTGTQEEVIRVPFKKYKDYTNIVSNNSYEQIKQSACDNCSNNPKNGGSGVCHCILGLTKTIW